MGLECNCRMESRVVCTIKTGEWVAVAHLFVAASQRNKQKGHAAKMPENPHILQAGRDRDLGFGMRWRMRRPLCMQGEQLSKCFCCRLFGRFRWWVLAKVENEFVKIHS